MNRNDENRQSIGQRLANVPGLRDVLRPLAALVQRLTGRGEDRFWRLMRRTAPEREASVLLLYSGERQYERYLGPEGVLREMEPRVLALGWGPAAQDGGAESDRAARGRLRDEISETWGVTDEQRHLPFVLVFESETNPVPFYLATAYRERRSDGAQQLEQLEAVVLRTIERAL